MSDLENFIEVKKKGRTTNKILTEEEIQQKKEKKAEANRKYYKNKNPDAGQVKKGRKAFLTIEEVRARDNARVKKWLEKKKLESQG